MAKRRVSVPVFLVVSGQGSAFRLDMVMEGRYPQHPVHQCSAAET
jgi:hypothetical protein